MPTKFLEAIDMRDTGKRKYVPPEIDVMESHEPMPYPTDARLYRVEVRIGYHAAVKDPGMLPIVKDRVTQAMAQQVYGEVMDQLINVDMAILSYDFERAHTELKKAMELMRP